MRTSVVTIASGRRTHLERQHDALLQGPMRPDQHIVVAMDDPGLLGWRSRSSLPPTVLPIDRIDGRLPLAAARNAGASRAIEDGAELVILLDVDCLPGPELLARYRAAAELAPSALLSGPVGYLGPGEFEPRHFSTARFPAFRPTPAPGELVDADPLLFWSLSFATTASTWRAIGGFDERYTGYGAEDTDFAQRAAEAGIGHLWVGGADAFHQHHDSHSPPIEHLDDILRNGERFARRWGFWPMRGWLDAFEAEGLIVREPDVGPLAHIYRRRSTP